MHCLQPFLCRVSPSFLVNIFPHTQKCWRTECFKDWWWRVISPTDFVSFPQLQRYILTPFKEISEYVGFCCTTEYQLFSSMENGARNRPKLWRLVHDSCLRRQVCRFQIPVREQARRQCSLGGNPTSRTRHRAYCDQRSAIPLPLEFDELGLQLH